MTRTRLRPATTRVAVAAWGTQVVLAVLWLLSSLIDEGSWWIWPFGLTWALIAAVAAYRARRRAVVVDDEGIELVSGLRRSATIPWSLVADVTPDPPGELVSGLAVVLTDTRVVETPLGKADQRLREAWAGRAP